MGERGPQQRRTGDPNATATKPPASLDKVAKAKWNDVVEDLLGRGCWSEMFSDRLESYCRADQELRELRALDPGYDSWREYELWQRAVRSAESARDRHSVKLGLDPISAGKLPPRVVADPGQAMRQGLGASPGAKLKAAS